MAASRSKHFVEIWTGGGQQESVASNLLSAAPQCEIGIFVVWTSQSKPIVNHLGLVFPFKQLQRHAGGDSLHENGEQNKCNTKKQLKTRLKIELCFIAFRFCCFFFCAKKHPIWTRVIWTVVEWDVTFFGHSFSWRMDVRECKFASVLFVKSLVVGNFGLILAARMQFFFSFKGAQMNWRDELGEAMSREMCHAIMRVLDVRGGFTGI